VELVNRKEVHSSKTDDELLALTAHRAWWEPAARFVLPDELPRRKLTGLYVRTRGASALLDQNPPFNTPAKIGAALLLLFAVGFGAVEVWAGLESHGDIDPGVGDAVDLGPIFAADRVGSSPCPARVSERARATLIPSFRNA
jgi:hypothetical protein